MPGSTEERLQARDDLAWSISVGGIGVVFRSRDGHQGASAPVGLFGGVPPAAVWRAHCRQPLGQPIARAVSSVR